MHTKPLLVIPRSSRVATMLDADMLAIEPRAQRVGVALIAPRSITAAELMAACSIWPNVLAHARVSRLAVILGLDAYVRAAPLLIGCRQVMQERNVDVAYFHEGHLESDQIRAFFERRRPQRRLTSDAMIKLSHRYALRGDIRNAAHARRLAEVAAGAS